jgi:uncharacterized membrane protein YeiB
VPNVSGSIGCAIALLGPALLVCRVEVIAKLLYPPAAMGSMSLTVCTAHLIVPATGAFNDQSVALFVLMGGGSMIPAVVIRRFTRMGPLEFLLSSAADATRRLARSRSALRPVVPLGEA